MISLIIYIFKYSLGMGIKNQLNHRHEEGSRMDRGVLGTDEKRIWFIFVDEPNRFTNPSYCCRGDLLYWMRWTIFDILPITSAYR